MSGNDGFTVDPDQLDDLRAHLSDIVSGMTNAGRVSGSYGPGELGPNCDVWNALQGFDGDWSNGLALIKDNVAGLVPRLAYAAQAYREADRGAAGEGSPGENSGS